MKLNIKKVRDFINPLLSKKSIEKEKFEKFKGNLSNYIREIEIQHATKQAEPNIVTNALKPFVESLGHETNAYSQSGQSGIDLAILKDYKPAVIFEAKVYQSGGMITQNNLNKKAFHEAVLYFMRERDRGNVSIFHIVITDFFNWFVFDAKDFEAHFWKNKTFKKLFDNYKNPSILGDGTADFYSSLEKELPKYMFDLIDAMPIDCAHFNLKEPQNDKNLIAIYKLLSSDTLLKEFNPNDANSLNREFYNELLYILGLEEEKVGGKKLISRAKNPQNGTFYELTKSELKFIHDEDEFDIIIQIIIIWLNRILFLKLLESQIVRWNGNKQELKFLNISKIEDFDRLNMLFFKILAVKISERQNHEFDYIPYLNSSLFERHLLEDKYLRISELANDTQITYYKNTALKDENKKRKIGYTDVLSYLFEFLDAYDFGTDSGEEISNENKSLINPSVLGLIFEKLNGYKDGSFYTPSFITMYMARESIIKSVLQKFNDAKGWNCQKLLDLHNKIDDIQEANAIIDTLTICDPAVGSGHFLVSALNEILFIKSELGILVDDEGKRIRDYRLSVENDELIIKDDEGEIFDYQRDSKAKARIQKTLFKEKQRIIEHSLFGVDINPNSVNICRLRLWIELLKNAYYREDGTLDTLPNIDINIKCGNSLISCFGLTDELKIKNIAIEIENYKQRVSDYKENLGTKRDVMQSISDLKDKFRLTLKAEWKVQKSLNEKLREYVAEYKYEGLSDNLTLLAIKNNYGLKQSLFEYKVDKKKSKKLLEEIKKLESNIEAIEKGKIYENAFEWRFEFPEVLDKDGDFVGFDVVIGNPPYVFAREHFTAQEKSFFVSQYKLSAYQLNLYILFLERSNQILKKNGQFSFIVPNNWLTINSAKGVREFILNHSDIGIVNFTAKVFDEANVDTAILTYNKSDQNPIVHLYESSGIDGMNLIKTTETLFFQNKTDAIINIEAFKNSGVYDIMDKIEANALPLKEVADVKAGLKAYETGKGKPPQTEEMKKNRIYHSVEQLDENYLPYLDGKDVSRYALGWSGEFLKYGDNLAAPRTFELFSTPRILVRQIPSRPPYCIHACYTDAIILNDLNSMNIVNMKESPLFILGVLNSRLMSFWFIHKFGKLSRGIFPQFKINELEQFPIMISNNQKPFEILVEYVIFLKALPNELKIDEYVSNEHITKQFEEVIDGMVFELYFTDEFKAKNIEFIKYVKEDFRPIDNLDEISKQEVIKEAYLKLCETKNPIRNNLLLLPIELEFIKTILWN